MLIINLWQLKTVVFLHWCLICAVLLSVRTHDSFQEGIINPQWKTLPSNIRLGWFVSFKRSSLFFKCINKFLMLDQHHSQKHPWRTLPTNVRLDWMFFPVTNPLAYSLSLLFKRIKKVLWYLDKLITLFHERPYPQILFCAMGFFMSNWKKVQFNADLFSDMQKYLYTVT